MNDSQPGPRQRGLVFQPSYEVDRLLVEPDCKRFDEMTAGAQWRIEEHAESCPVVASKPAGDVRVARTQVHDGSPIIDIFFTIDSDSQCSAWSVLAFPDPAVGSDD